MRIALSDVMKLMLMEIEISSINHKPIVFVETRVNQSGAEIVKHRVHVKDR